MKPEDVSDVIMAACDAVLVPGKPISTSDLRRALAAVIPLIEAREREACAEVADAEASVEGIAQRIATAIRALPLSGDET